MPLWVKRGDYEIIDANTITLFDTDLSNPFFRQRRIKGNNEPLKIVRGAVFGVGLKAAQILGARFVWFCKRFCKKNRGLNFSPLCTRSRGRTGTTLLSLVFETNASTDSAIRAFPRALHGESGGQR